MGSLNSFVGKKPFDIEQYETYAEYFRGDKESGSKLEGPFAYRPLVPLLASFLPFKALTSLNVVNVSFLVIALFFLIELLKLFNLKRNYLFLGGILFTYSFPVFYYGTSGYIDSVLIAFLMAGIYLILSEKIFLFIISFICGMGVKETIIILIPVFIVYLYLNNKFSFKKKLLLVILILIIYGTGTILLRNLTPGAESYLWFPSIKILFYNLVRVKTFFSISLTFGIPGIGALFCLYKLLRGKILFTNQAPLITGMLVSILISFFSLFAAYADGRHIWTSYPFTIPLALIYLQSLKASDSFIVQKLNR